jgi:hypothetical protein
MYRGPAQMDSYKNTLENPITGYTVFVIGYGTDVINGKNVAFWLVLNSHSPNWGKYKRPYAGASYIWGSQNCKEYNFCIF